MGALSNEEQRSFIRTFKGNFTKKANAETPGAVKRLNKNNVEVWELLFNTISDVIVQEITRHESEEYGFSWNILLAHTKSDETFTVNLPYSGRITMGLFLRLPNTDINKSMTMKLFYFTEEDKSALVVYQGGNKVEAFWTKDAPGELPELVEKEVNNKKVWDSTERMKFIEAYLEKDVRPKMNAFSEFEGEEEAKGSATDGVDEHEGHKVYTNEPEWDAEGKVLKMKHTDGKFYECDETGKFKRDQNGNLVGVLPF